MDTRMAGITFSRSNRGLRFPLELQDGRGAPGSTSGFGVPGRGMGQGNTHPFL